MTTALADLVKDVKPDSTVLLFGAGSSLPSNAPSVATIIEHLSKKFRQPSAGFNLSELTDLIEQKTKDRRRLIDELRAMFQRNKPTGGLLNLPLYSWKSIYTTNYDTLIEQSYTKKGRRLDVYTSNFDFTVGARSVDTKLFKIHGTIDKDISMGHNSRIIISGNDYSHTSDYRQHLYNTLKADLAESNLIIIGHSLADNDIRDIVTHAITLNSQTFAAGRITLLMYERDDDRALLYEGKGLKVVFGGIDEFFTELGKSPGPLFDFEPSDNPLDKRPALVPTVLDVSHQAEVAYPSVSRMFNGWPATYADIVGKLTFDRTISDKIVEFIRSEHGLATVLLGASGVGKTTAVRQSMLKLRQSGYLCWEHKTDYTLETDEWVEIARDLRKAGKLGVLFIDDAHSSLHEINELVDGLASEGLASLALILASGRNSWRPRAKTPNLFKTGKQFHLSQLDSNEIDKLISLVDTSTPIGQLVESSFSGFSRPEKRRRLVERCHSDMFVCMRNIFASENFDDIILREYMGLPERLQDIYRLVSALETSGIRVHRQLIIRLLGIPMAATMAILDGLTDIVTEYELDAKKHIYGWRGRHPIINSIIMKYKYNDITKIVELFDKTIDNILPTYEIEIRSIIELCNIETGIARIPDKKTQNRLLRKMISVAPGERVPRHRLIRNLIEISEFDQALTEIRIFDKDFKTDGPVARYKINLLVARASRTSGIMKEDRLVILEQARELAVASIRRHSNAVAVFGAYAEVGTQFYQLAGRTNVFDDAIEQLKEAEKRLGDPEITRIIRRFDRQMAGQMPAPAPEEDDPTVPDFD
jgi:SIR2-like domain